MEPSSNNSLGTWLAHTQGLGRASDKQTGQVAAVDDLAHSRQLRSTFCQTPHNRIAGQRLMRTVPSQRRIESAGVAGRQARKSAEEAEHCRQSLGRDLLDRAVRKISDRSYLLVIHGGRRRGACARGRLYAGDGPPLRHAILAQLVGVHALRSHTCCRQTRFRLARCTARWASGRIRAAPKQIEENRG